MNRNPVLIQAGYLYDGTSDSIMDNGWLRMENGRILDIGVGNPPGGEVIRYPGCTILPGLIDAHVHLTMDGTEDPVAHLQQETVPRATLRAVHNAARQIKAGVTTVRDCGCQAGIAIELAEAVETGVIKRSPRIIACGPVLCITGGHGAFIGIEADGVEQVRMAVRTVIKQGARFIKLIATGGVISKGTATGATQFDFQELSVAVHEAHKVGLKTAVHAHGAQGICFSLQAGVDTVEHASYVDEEGISLFHKTGACFVSTLLASQRQADHLDEVPPYVRDKIQRHIETEYASIARLIHEGIPAVGGTDSGTPFNPHGDLAEQLMILHRLGLNRIQAIQSGTSLAALALGIAEDTGSLQVGKRADILIVEGNPGEDLAKLKKVKAVWRDGLKII